MRLIGIIMGCDAARGTDIHIILMQIRFRNNHPFLGIELPITEFQQISESKALIHHLTKWAATPIGVPSNPATQLGVV